MATFRLLLVPVVITLILLVELVPAQRDSERRGSSEEHRHREGEDRDRDRGSEEHRDREGRDRDHGTQGPYSNLGRGNHHRRDRGHRQNVDHRLRSGSIHGSATGRESSRSRSHCPGGSFRNRTTGECVLCSTCPVNEIIRRPCGVHRDTVCGPFYEFKPGQHQGGSSHYQQDDPQHADGPHRALSNRPGHYDQGPMDDNSNSNETADKMDDSQRYGYHGDKDATNTQQVADGHTTGPTVQRSVEQWRELCYGLIGALAAVTLLALIYIIVTQLHARRRGNKHSDAHCRTVLSPTMRVFANGLLSNTDYQKITPYAEESGSRRSRHWLLRHLRPWAHRDNSSRPNEYVQDGDVVLHVIPEAVEMERLQRAPVAAEGDQGHVAQGQAAQGHAAQGQRLGSTQSWDSGISTHDGHKV